MRFMSKTPTLTEYRSTDLPIPIRQHPSIYSVIYGTLLSTTEARYTSDTKTRTRFKSPNIQHSTSRIPTQYNSISNVITHNTTTPAPPPPPPSPPVSLATTHNHRLHKLHIQKRFDLHLHLSLIQRRFNFHPIRFPIDLVLQLLTLAHRQSFR